MAERKTSCYDRFRLANDSIKVASLFPLFFFQFSLSPGKSSIIVQAKIDAVKLARSHFEQLTYVYFMD